MQLLTQRKELSFNKGKKREKDNPTRRQSIAGLANFGQDKT